MIAIITDSTCDIPQTLINQYQIHVVPQLIIWGDDQYRDRIDLLPQAFYERLSVDPQRPTTSQASAADFGKAIADVVKEGAEAAIILTVSSAMSGTYQMAKKAADAASIPVEVVDSKGPTMSLGWQVLAGARARDAGRSMEAILLEVKKVRESLVQYVAMESLEYLQTGGRIGDAVRWVGTMLKVKPLVSINHESGRVQPVTLTRTHKALVRNLRSRFTAHFEGKSNVHVAVLHGNVLAEAQSLAEEIRQVFDPTELLINITGPVLGINTGPGALALCGYALS